LEPIQRSFNHSACVFTISGDMLARSNEIARESSY
jgi:hypothetical protein